MMARNFADLLTAAPLSLEERDKGRNRARHIITELINDDWIPHVLTTTHSCLNNI